MTGNTIIKASSLAAGVLAAVLMLSAESFAGPGKGGAGNGGHGGGHGGHGGGHSGGGMGKGGGGNGGTSTSDKGGDCSSDDRRKYRFCNHRYERVVVRRGPVRRHRVKRRQQKRATRRLQTRAVYTTSWAPGYHCSINNAPVYNRTTCRRAQRLARKGRGYAFADNSGYASFVTTTARRRVVVKRRVVRQRRRVERRRIIRQRPPQQLSENS